MNQNNALTAQDQPEDAINSFIVPQVYASGIREDDMARQEQLEEEMRSLGIDRYESFAADLKRKGRESDIPSTKRLIDHAHVLVRESVAQWVEETKAGRAGRMNKLARYIYDMDPDVVTHVALRALMDGLSAGFAMTLACRNVGNAIEEQAELFALKKAMGDRFTTLLRKYQTTGRGQINIVNRFAAAAEREQGFVWQGWPLNDRVKLGYELIDRIIQTTGIVRQVYLMKNGKKVAHLEATEKTLEWLSSQDTRISLLTPMYLPTVVPPRPWTAPDEGGYWTGRVRGLTISKTHDRDVLRRLTPEQMPLVYKGINVIQATPWSINKTVLDVARYVFDSGMNVADVPPANLLSLPPRPDCLPEDRSQKLNPEQEVALKEWRKEACQIHETNLKMRSKRLSFSRILWVAEKFRNEPELYFPHQMDFRGRVYSVPLFLSPQGADVCRGILQFANGVPISDEEDAAWLAIHGANCFGVDKVSFDDRLAWVASNEDRIRAVAADPLANLWWTEADSPFQFLAWCLEWVQYLEIGFGFVSLIPVALDGTCNGLQNFSAVLRDPVGAAATNLIPAEKPQDIYGEVAKVVLDRARNDAQSSSIAAAWVPHITRSVVKRPVMTLAYGATLFGFKSQVWEDTIKPWKYDNLSNYPAEFGNGWAAADYLGNAVWDCVGQVVVAAQTVMTYLQEAANQVGERNLPLEWTTPTGFVVRNRYMVEKGKEINLATYRKRVRAWINEETDQINKRRCASAVSPNWVHSLDASHLILTVCRAYDEGVRSFALIHDSYGTHAGNTGSFSAYIREEFVRMYEENDVLEQFKAETEAKFGLTLPTPPAKGDLNLQETVIRSDYFFA